MLHLIGHISKVITCVVLLYTRKMY